MSKHFLKHPLQQKKKELDMVGVGVLYITTNLGFEDDVIVQWLCNRYKVTITASIYLIFRNTLIQNGMFIG